MNRNIKAYADSVRSKSTWQQANLTLNILIGLRDGKCIARWPESGLFGEGETHDEAARDLSGKITQLIRNHNWELPTHASPPQEGVSEILQDLNNNN